MVWIAKYQKYQKFKVGATTKQKVWAAFCFSFIRMDKKRYKVSRTCPSAYFGGNFVLLMCFATLQQTALPKVRQSIFLSQDHLSACASLLDPTARHGSVIVALLVAVFSLVRNWHKVQVDLQL